MTRAAVLRDFGPAGIGQFGAIQAVAVVGHRGASSRFA
jgi:hypothetical protein